MDLTSARGHGLEAMQGAVNGPRMKQGGWAESLEDSVETARTFARQSVTAAACGIERAGGHAAR